MKKITWKYVKKLNSQTDVDEFLSKYNLRIQKKLLDCIIMNNRGHPSLQIFNTTKRKIVSLISFIV